MRESRVQGVDESKVWKTLLKHRWDVKILKTNPCLNEGQILKVIYKTGQDLNLINGMSTWTWIPDDDLTFGIHLFSALYYCPETIIEAAKLFALFQSLITDENMKTVVATTMHNIQPRAGNNIKDFTAINMWYHSLDERYDFSLEDNLLPLLTTDHLVQLKALDPPFLKQRKGINHQHQNISKPGSMQRTISINSQLIEKQESN